MYLFLIILAAILLIWPFTKLLFGLIHIIFALFSGVLGLAFKLILFAAAIAISILLFPFGMIAILLVIFIVIAGKRINH